MDSLTDTYTLNNGVKIPIVGFGTWEAPNGPIAQQAIEQALAVGYRHLDTARVYWNEASVGAAIKNSGIPREQIFVTTKLWNTDHSYQLATAALDKALQRLALDYVDLFLIHTPATNYPDWVAKNAETWRALEDAYHAGKVRAIGVSNFNPDQLTQLLATATVTPAVNQIQLNPQHPLPATVAFDNAHQILNEAYSPFGHGKLLQNHELLALAATYHKSVTQILLRWSLQHGYLPLPKSVHDQYIQANTEIFDFSLTPTDMAKLDQLA